MRGQQCDDPMTFFNSKVVKKQKQNKTVSGILSDTGIFLIKFNRVLPDSDLGPGEKIPTVPSHAFSPFFCFPFFLGPDSSFPALASGVSKLDALRASSHGVARRLVSCMFFRALARRAHDLQETVAAQTRTSKSVAFEGL